MRGQTFIPLFGLLALSVFLLIGCEDSGSDEGIVLSQAQATATTTDADEASPTQAASASPTTTSTESATPTPTAPATATATVALTNEPFSVQFNALRSTVEAGLNPSPLAGDPNLDGYVTACGTPPDASMEGTAATDPALAAEAQLTSCLQLIELLKSFGNTELQPLVDLTVAFAVAQFPLAEADIRAAAA
jgi:hypothetical protein